MALSQLWSSVQQELTQKMKLLIQLIELIEGFNQKYDVMVIWLEGLEKSLTKEKLGSSPEKQKDRIKQVSDCQMIFFAAESKLEVRVL